MINREYEPRSESGIDIHIPDPQGLYEYLRESIQFKADQATSEDLISLKVNLLLHEFFGETFDRRMNQYMPIKAESYVDLDPLVKEVELRLFAGYRTYQDLEMTAKLFDLSKPSSNTLEGEFIRLETIVWLTDKAFEKGDTAILVNRASSLAQQFEETRRDLTQTVSCTNDTPESVLISIKNERIGLDLGIHLSDHDLDDDMSQRISFSASLGTSRENFLTGIQTLSQAVQTTFAWMYPITSRTQVTRPRLQIDY